MNIFKFRIVIIGLLIIALLVPVFMVSSLVDERKERYEELVDQMGRVWGRPKDVYSVLLSDKTSYYAPSEVNITGVVRSELRKKGIFSIPFYTADLKIKAEFPAEELTHDVESINLFLSDISAVEIQEIKCSGKSISFRKDSNSIPGDVPVISMILPADENDAMQVRRIELSVRMHGIDRLHFSQFAEKTAINLKSNWLDPNFSGSCLPSSREINSNGFSAEWELVNPIHAAKSNSYSIDTNDTFGVNFFVPVNIYSLTDRAVKYAVLFIALTFLAFFIFESMNAIRIHPVQYLMVGFALVIFYLLLLSLSEHMSFVISYVISSLAVIVVITLYSIKVLYEKSRSAVMAVLLTVLYVLMYVLLNLEDYSLVFGSVSLFVILAVVMYITRNIDWYDLQRNIGSQVMKEE